MLPSSPPAEASAPGSTLIAHQITEELLDLIRAHNGEVEHPPFTPELMRTWASALPAQPAEASCSGAGRLPGRHGRAVAAAGNAEQQAGLRAACLYWCRAAPQDAAPCVSMQALAAAGWRLEQAVSRAEIAHEICGGRPEGQCSFEVRVGQGSDRFAVFVVAAKG